MKFSLVSENLSLPISSRSIRFGPTIAVELACRLWKVWADGDEVYATARVPGGKAKISIHASGEIHLSLRPKQNRQFNRLRRLTGPWSHAFQMKFLLSPGAKTPADEEPESKDKTAYLIPVPAKFFLCADLVIGDSGTSWDTPLPFDEAKVLWRKKLRAGRAVVLLARTLPFNDDELKQVKYIREELRPTATFKDKPDNAYVEMLHIHTSAGVNMLSIIPMGDEAIRWEGDEESEATASEIKTFRYQSPRASVAIAAPNGNRVAIVEIDDVDQQIEMIRGRPVKHKCGLIRMRLEPANLIPNAQFTAAPVGLISAPTIDGGGLNNWQYTVAARFDDEVFQAEIGPNSGGLLKKNFAFALTQLADDEEIVVIMPYESLALSARIDAPNASADMIGQFTLRGRRS